MASGRTFYRMITWAVLRVGANLVGRAFRGTAPFLAKVHMLACVRRRNPTLRMGWGGGPDTSPTAAQLIC